MGNTSKNATIAELTGMASGLRKHYAGQTLQVNGEAMTTDEVLNEIGSYEAEVAATQAAYKAWKVQLDRQETARATVTERMRGLRRMVQGAFGAKSMMVLDFGMKPLVVPVRSVESRRVAVEKGLATREARHTMGKRQKAKIHGVVSSPSPTSGPSPSPSPTSGPSPSPSPSPTPTPTPTPTPSRTNGSG